MTHHGSVVLRRLKMLPIIVYLVELFYFCYFVVYLLLTNREELNQCLAVEEEDKVE